MRDYADYLRQLDRIGGGTQYPHDLQASHVRLSERARQMVNSWHLQFMFRARRKLWKWAAWQSDGLYIRLVESTNEIVSESEYQHNCVAGYAQSHAAGGTAIFVLRKLEHPKESWHTVELDPETLHVKQCRGYRNADACAEAEEFIAAWVKRLQEIRKERKKSA